jgi:hypothetical protein
MLKHLKENNMSNNLIPIKNAPEHLEALERKLKKVPAFGSVDQFIMLYNTALINTKNEEVVKVAALIEAAYSNVVRVGGRFIIRSQAEDILSKSQFLLTKAVLPAALKRIANTMAEEDYSPDTKMIFLGSDPGVLYVETNDGLEKYLGAEKLFKAKEELASNPYLTDKIEDYLREDSESLGEDCYMLLSELANMGDTFILKLGELLDLAI